MTGALDHTPGGKGRERHAKPATSNRESDARSAPDRCDESATFLHELLPLDLTHRFGLVWTLDLKDEKRSRWFSSAEQAHTIVKEAGHATNIYFGVGISPNDFGEKFRCRIADIAGLLCLWLDVDVRGVTHDSEKLPATVEEAMSLVRRMPLQATFVINSGTGVQGLWLFKEPWLFETPEEKQQAILFVARWANTFERWASARGWSVKGTFDLARVMRVPGTFNLCKGRCDPKPTGILEHHPEARYEPDDFDPYLLAQDDEGLDAIQPSEMPLIDVKLDPSAVAPAEKLAALREAEPRFNLTWQYQIDGVYTRQDFSDPTDVSRYCMSIAAFAVLAGWSNQEVADAIIEFRREHSDDLKLDNPHFWQLTIGKPRAKAKKRERERADAAEKAMASAERVLRADDPTAAYRVAAELAALPLADREAMILRYEEKFGRKLNKRQLRRAIENQTRARAQHKIVALRPKIDLDGPWLQVVQETVTYLSRRNVPPRRFERGGLPTYVTQDEKGRKIIATMNETYLRGEEGREIIYYQVHEKRGEIEVPPPIDVARDLLLRMNDTLRSINEKPLPPLCGLVEVPVLRGDGTIIETPGYDEATGLYYWPSQGLVVPPIPQAPSPAELAAALALIDEMIGEFPYASQIDRANTYALLLTTVLRNSVDLAPVALIDAPQAGTGKSLLASAIHAVQIGTAGVMTSIPETDDEMRKLITSALIEGARIMLLDNLDGALFHPSLAKAVTAPTWSDRILGQSKTVAVPQSATWIVTGNNIVLGGDIPRRCYWIRLDAKSSKPWDDGRQYKHPELIPWVLQDRGRLVAALLTICRAWYAAGKPEYGAVRLGSFEAWSQTIGNILAHAGITGFLANRDELYAQADEDGPQWERFLAAWYAKYGQASVTAATIEDDVQRDAELREALPDALSGSIERHQNTFEATYRIKEPGKFKIRLGKALKQRLGRRFGTDNLYLSRGDDSHAKVATWTVRVAGSAGSCGSVSDAGGCADHSAHTGTCDTCAAYAFAHGNGLKHSRHSPPLPADADLAHDQLEREGIQSG